MYSNAPFGDEVAFAALVSIHYLWLIFDMPSDANNIRKFRMHLTALILCWSRSLRSLFYLSLPSIRCVLSFFRIFSSFHSLHCRVLHTLQCESCRRYTICADFLLLYLGTLHYLPYLVSYGFPYQIICHFVALFDFTMGYFLWIIFFFCLDHFECE